MDESTAIRYAEYRQVNAIAHPTTGSARTGTTSPADGRIRRLWPLLLAGSAAALAGNSAVALELSDFRIESGLGQPLRASIAYALSPNEQLGDYCIYLRPGVPGAGLPTISQARVSVADGRILITGTTPVMEPVLGLTLRVDCPYTPKLLRNYTVMLDPAQPVTSAPPATTVAGVTRPAGTAADDAVPTRTAAAPRAGGAGSAPAAITPSSDYRVRAGDTASGIAARIQDRPAGIRAAAEAIFAANPHAFDGGDIDRLKAGVVLSIPSLDGSSAPVVRSTPAPSPGPAPSPAQVTDATSNRGGSTYAGPADVPPAEPETVNPAAVTPEPTYAAPATVAEPARPAVEAATPSPADAPADIVGDRDAGPATAAGEAAAADTGTEPAEATTPAEPSAAEPAATALRPGDILLDESVDATATDAPAAGARPAARTISVRGDDAGSLDWLMWLAGGALALVGTVLLFGRRLRERFGSVAVSAPAAPSRVRESDDEPNRENEAIPADDVDFTLGDAAPQGLALDADFDAGTGFDNSGDIDVAQDFGFSATADLNAALDMELPDNAGDEPESHPTDVIPPHRNVGDSILEDEVLPDDDATGEHWDIATLTGSVGGSVDEQPADTDDIGAEAEDDYDMSMIVDATKQRFEDTNVTEKDLAAVPLDDYVAAERGDDEGEYTLNDDLGSKILEMDYQKEFEATRALDDELARAAEDLAARMDEPDEDPAEAPGPDRSNVLDLTGAFGGTAGRDSEEAGDVEAIGEAFSDGVDDGEVDLLLPDPSGDDDTGINESVADAGDDLDETGINEAMTAGMPSIDDDATDDTVQSAEFSPDDAFADIDADELTAERTVVLPDPDDDDALSAAFDFLDDDDLTSEQTVMLAEADDQAAERLSADDSVEITAQMPGEDATSEVTARIPDTDRVFNEDLTAEMRKAGLHDDETAEMPVAGDDTSEMDVESGRINTKKKNAR